MNEIRDLIIGIDIGREISQICYYDRKADEARSVSMKVGGSLFEAPTCLCYRPEHGEYCVGVEAEYFSREKDGLAVGNLYDICKSEETVKTGGDEKAPWELAAIFLKGMLKFMGVVDLVKNTKCLIIVMPALDRVQVSNLQKACGFIGFPPEKCMLLDYGESFYYYVLSQKIETWSRCVAWYSFTEAGVTFRRLARKPGVKSTLIELSEPQTASLRSGREERDEDFCDFIRKTMGKDMYSSVQMTGTGFDQEWAKKSVRMLCYQKRKVYFGNNLFAKGACLAGVEKLEKKSLKNYRYLGDALVSAEIGMDMKIMGAPAYHCLVPAGNNWYESRGGCELILDDAKELVFIISELGESEKKRVSMALPGLPVRPNKTTRLSLELQYVSPRECSITVRDLGFGEMYPASGKVWKETARW